MDYKEKVINLLNSKELSQEQKEKLESIFPELAESEDERIRKALMQNLKERFGTKGNMGKGLDMPDVLAWFEKQAEQKPTKEHNVCDFCEDRYGCVNHCPTKLIEEQKPVNFSDLRTWKYIVDAVWTEKEGIGQYLDSPFTEEVAKKLQKRFGKIEQKPANNVKPKFREGDSIQFKGFGHNRYTIKEVCGLSHYINTMGNSMDMSYTDANFEVIKDSDKVEISTAEWSEEDEKMLKDTIRFCELCGNQVSANWLKSLKSHSRWKPSDKQMNTLEYYMHTLVCNEHKEILFGLYTDLKKLKE